MTNDERNFRSAYYEKVGFKNVEEKKSIEMLLKERVDIDKLKQFCVRYCVPPMYRNLVWKILLEILPVNKSCHEFVTEQRTQEYEDLCHYARTVKIVSGKSTKLEMFHALWKIYKQSSRTNNLSEADAAYLDIVKTLMSMNYFTDDKDIFWVATGFYERLSCINIYIQKLIDTTHSILEKEDLVLYKHLMNIGALDYLPSSSWFQRCFAGVLSDNVLAKIWDKVIGGASFKLLAFVAAGVLIHLKHRLIQANTMVVVMECIHIFPEETADIIVNYSIQIWHECGATHCS